MLKTLVILAGGLGTRISEESHNKPKPMIEIGSKPIIWHIMKYYSQFGVNDFIICCGYKGYVIKEYFANYYLHQSDVTIDFETNQTTFHNSKAEKWKISLIDTGENTMTGGRIKRIANFIQEDNFFLTYGDGVSNVDIQKQYDFHKEHGKLCTITSVVPPGRFGALEIDSTNTVREFKEKPKGDGNLINGGFFVLNKKAIEFIKGDETIWEETPLKKLAANGQLISFNHQGFWQPMDTLRDKMLLEKLYDNNQAPWKIWT